MRRDGKIVTLQLPPKGFADFGPGKTRTITVTWGDVSTAYYSTRIPNIDVEFELTPQVAQLADLPPALRPVLGSAIGKALLRTYARTMRAAPDEQGSRDKECVIIGEVRNLTGDVRRARLRTPGAYWLTAQTALLIAKRLQTGNAPVGFQTAASAYGSGLILEVPGTVLEDLG